jgi:hypothetical protein
MQHHQHRMSQDIDIFIDDAQYLAFLSPRLGRDLECVAYDEAAHYLKLRYPEGDIDFIVSGVITATVVCPIDVAGDVDAGIPHYRFLIDHPVEIALKKLWYRGADLKVGTSSISPLSQRIMSACWCPTCTISIRKAAILDRLDRTDPDFLVVSIDELDIMPAYRALAREAIATVRNIIKTL